MKANNTGEVKKKLTTNEKDTALALMFLLFCGFISTTVFALLASRLLSILRTRSGQKEKSAEHSAVEICQ